MCLKNIFFFLFLSIISFPAFSQEKYAFPANIDFDVVLDEDTVIIVSFDILKSSPIEKYEVELFFEDEDGNRLYTSNVIGDIGKEIPGGKGKQITWDFFKDVDELYAILPVVRITKVNRYPGGPGNALYSVFVPGLGDRYVINHHGMAIKPYYKTIAAYGLIGYGVFQKIRSDNYYNDYSNSENYTDLDDLYNKANKSNHQFYVAAGLGIAIWATDVIWVTLKGFQNNNKNKKNPQSYENNRLFLGGDQYGLNLTYKIRF